AEKREGGWRGYRPLAANPTEKESDVTTSFYLRPKDDQPIASFKPGHSISLKAHIEEEEYTHIRQYRLSVAPGEACIGISVKREDECEATPAGIVSNYMHYHVEEGYDVFLSVPAGDFYLDVTSSRPVLLIAGGVGLTPLMSMFNTLIEQYPS